ncbi:MAG: PAC2 family protein, partial [Candidatus Odinarchaeia archaeon]
MDILKFDLILKKFKKIELKGKKVICLQGMPGIAMVGKYTVDYLIENLKAEKIVELTFFDFPPQVIITNGLMIIPEIKIYHHFNEINLTDIILLTGDFQPLTHMGVYKLSRLLVDLLKELGVKLVIALGASAVDVPIKEPEIYISSTSNNIIKKFKDDFNLLPFTSGIITGMNGLLPSILNETANMEGVVLLTQACKYLTYDYYSIKKLLKLLSLYLELKVDFSNLDEKIKELEEEIN